MFYSLLFISWIFIFVGLAVKSSPKKNAFMALLGSYVFTLFFMVLYLSRHIYYYNVLTQYFYFPKSIWRYLYFLHIDKFLLMRLLNFSASSIVFTSIHFTLIMTSPVQKKTRDLIQITTLVYLGLILFLHDPLIDTKLYYFWIPERISPAQYLLFRNTVNLVVRSLNSVIILSGSILMLYTFVKAPRIRLIRINMLSLTIAYFFSGLTYSLFLSFLPAHYLNISKISNSYSYKALILPVSPVLYKLFPLFLLLVISIITISFYRLNTINQKIDARELAISRQIHASTITSSVLSHYVKNELVAIQAAIEDIDRQVPGTASVDTALNRIDHLFERLDLMHRTIDTNSVELRSTELHKLLERTLNLFESDIAEAEVRLSIPKEPILVLIDDDYFEQAIYNILRNAFDAMNLNSTNVNQLHIEIHKNDTWVFLSIRDNGNGIRPEQLSQIFIPYYSSQPLSKNWGLGLSHTFNIIKAHEGKIEVDSELGVGTTFRVLLPNIE